MVKITFAFMFLASMILCTVSEEEITRRAQVLSKVARGDAPKEDMLELFQVLTHKNQQDIINKLSPLNQQSFNEIVKEVDGRRFSLEHQTTWCVSGALISGTVSLFTYDPLLFAASVVLSYESYRGYKLLQRIWRIKDTRSYLDSLRTQAAA